MSLDIPARKKRTTSSTTPAPDGDHRKRRRNRTTQSCLNCHTSKRMCDRKRPACARCTQLGLTGLCVYEVDDPSQRSETQDESSRLLQRVAELEGVIRELKNKPHPRWVQSGNNANEEFEKWHTRSQLREESEEQISSQAPSSPGSSSSSDRGDVNSNVDMSSRAPSVTKSSSAYHASIQLHSEDIHRRMSYPSTSPQSTPSPCVMTPTEEYSSPPIVIASPADVSRDYDLASMFLSYPGLMGCEDNTYALAKDGLSDDIPYPKENGGHCGCLHEPSSYSVMLELSLRLRKASDILTRSTNHRMGPSCLLHQRISDLDTFATNVLGNISIPPEDLSTSISPHDRSRQINASGHMVHPCQSYNPRTMGGPTISPQSLHSLRSWDLMPNVANSSGSCDDSFMSWEPSRRA